MQYRTQISPYYEIRTERVDDKIQVTIVDHHDKRLDLKTELTIGGARDMVKALHLAINEEAINPLDHENLK